MQEEEEQETTSRRKQVGCEHRSLASWKEGSRQETRAWENLPTIYTIIYVCNLPSVVLFSSQCRTPGHFATLPLFTRKITYGSYNPCGATVGHCRRGCCFGHTAWLCGSATLPTQSASSRRVCLLQKHCSTGRPSPQLTLRAPGKCVGVMKPHELV